MGNTSSRKLFDELITQKVHPIIAFNAYLVYKGIRPAYLYDDELGNESVLKLLNKHFNITKCEKEGHEYMHTFIHINPLVEEFTDDASLGRILGYGACSGQAGTNYGYGIRVIYNGDYQLFSIVCADEQDDFINGIVNDIKNAFKEDDIRTDYPDIMTSPSEFDPVLAHLVDIHYVVVYSTKDKMKKYPTTATKKEKISPKICTTKSKTGFGHKRSRKRHSHKRHSRKRHSRK